MTPLQRPYQKSEPYLNQKGGTPEHPVSGVFDCLVLWLGAGMLLVVRGGEESPWIIVYQARAPKFSAEHACSLVFFQKDIYQTHTY